MSRYRSGMAASTILLALCADFSGAATAGDEGWRERVLGTLRKATTYYRENVASHGGYVYYYSVDLQRRWGEGEATRDQIWVQPPGTPTVGMAYLAAFAATRDRFYLDAAREAAEALVHGQLQSGGWTNCIDFDPRGERVARYRNGKRRGKNNSSLDDDQTQSAIRFLMHTDRALDFRHPEIHEAVRVALAALLSAQFPNGGFPQVWTGPVARQPILRASYPDYDWRTEGRIKNYWDMYTLNDNLAGHVADTLIDAHEIYGDDTYRKALVRLGDFLLLARMPDPQPAWAQQYNYDMHPIWARKFEPPAISGWESQDAMETLLKIHRQTQDQRYLDAIPNALDYLRRSRLPDGRLARYYELRTNRPLYMIRRGATYTLTHDDSSLPSHYGWKVPSRLEDIEREYRRVRSGRVAPGAGHASSEFEEEVRRIVRGLDEHGRWVSTYTGQPLVGQPAFEPNRQFLSSEVFSQNVEALSRYLQGDG